MFWEGNFVVVLVAFLRFAADSFLNKSAWGIIPGLGVVITC